MRIEPRRIAVERHRGQARVMRHSIPKPKTLRLITETQERTLRRTQLLKLKAEAELARLEKASAASRGGERARLAVRKRCV